jgi:hypothetical protein
MSPRNVEFRTLDGLALRGLFYTTGKPQQPCIIMTHGVSRRPFVFPVELILS